MGKAGRERVVALTRTRKHLRGRESKQTVLEELRSMIDNYDGIYVISTENMRNALLKELRTTWRDSRIFFGRKKIAQVAFGRNDAEEYLEGLQKMSKQMKGNVGLLFTNREHEEVVRFFENYGEMDFARAGNRSTETVQLTEGELEMFEGSQEQNLRLVGLPVGVKRGKVWLSQDFTVCEKGEVLTPEKAKILEFLGIKQALFKVVLKCCYRKKEAHFKLLK
eukprot:GFKZ01011789.1.p1 GENE.GFKZ01011789.1~~GFKZ01011789.1.p1  ORF type:complete len:222 (+),score=42.49 GFKZ01011789.1:155-820(+)